MPLAPHRRAPRRLLAAAAATLAALAALGWTLAAPRAADAPRFTRITAGEIATDRASTGGTTWVDYDADGDLDLFVTNGYDVSRRPVPQADRLYRNDGGGRFTSQTNSPLATDSGYSSGSTWADYDNDGDLDAFVSTQINQPDLLYRNEGGGRFTRVTEGPLATTPGNSFSASWVDVDNDGWVDLFVSNGGLGGRAISFLFRNERGTFTRVADSPVVADSAASVGASWADYDNDGDQDLVIPRLAMPAAGIFGPALFRNDGDWRFTRVADGPVVNDTVVAYSSAWGDMDNDGDLDLAIGAGFAASRLFRNDGGGTFTRITEGDFVTMPSFSYIVNWADADNDGDLDLLQGHWGAASYLWLNRGDGTLDRAAAGDLGRLIGFACNASWGDYDGDGDLDVYIGNWPNAPGTGEMNQFYRNDGRNGSWLIVRLEGTPSNRAALGARVSARATIGGRARTQIREVAGHTGWRSQNPLEQHFGLGDAARVQEIVVRWPSGRVDRVSGVRANQRVTIREGEGLVGR